MEETKTEEQTSEKTEEQSTQTEETTEETKVESSELEQKNKDLFARAKKAEEGEKKLKEELVKLQPKETPKQSADADPWKERMEFVVENRDLKKEEVQEIIRYAEGAKITYEEALKTPFIANALKAMQAEEKSEQATPSPSAPVRSGINIAIGGGQLEGAPRFEDGKAVNPVKPKTFSELRAERAKK